MFKMKKSSNPGLLFNLAVMLMSLSIMAAAQEGYSIFHETMADMTWQEVEKAAKDGAIVLLPTAVIEEHGPHMGCGVDTYMAYQTCQLVRRELESRGIKTLIAPPMFWGINRTTKAFPGSFTVKPETMKALLEDILISLKSWGFEHVYDINWHNDGLHRITLLLAMKYAQESLGMDARFVLSEEDAARFQLKGDEPFILVHKSPVWDQPPQEYMDLHAGAGETGLMAAYFPDQVNLELTEKLESTKLTSRDIEEWIVNPKKVTPLGYYGNPAGHNSSKSKDNQEKSCKMIADAIEKALKDGK